MLDGHRGTRAVQRMVEFAPSTGGLALWVRHVDLSLSGPAADDETPAPHVATDGHTLFYAASFERLPLAEQVGHVAHEVLHIALRHPQRFLDLQQLLGDVDLRLFNTCADAIVNSTLGHLGWLTLPSGAVMLDKLLGSALGLRQGSEKSLLEWDVERLYRAIDDRRAQPQDGKRSGDGKGDGTGDGKGSDKGASASSANQPADQQADQQAGQQASQRVDGQRSASVRALGKGTAADLRPGGELPTAPETEAEEARTWSERLLRAHASDGAFSMLRTLMADLPRARTPWEQVLRTLLARSLAPQPAISWSRPARSYIANQGRAGAHRRMPWEPGFSGVKAVPQLVVIVDVSGSIDHTLLARFAREIEAIVRRLEARLVLVIGDDRVRRVAHFEAGAVKPGRFNLSDIQFDGGGDTDFTPLLEEAGKHHPDITVVLTDLDGPARRRPRWPVIWAVPETHTAAVAPFGRLLSLR